MVRARHIKMKNAEYWLIASQEVHSLFFEKDMGC